MTTPDLAALRGAGPAKAEAGDGPPVDPLETTGSASGSEKGGGA